MPQPLDIVCYYADIGRPYRPLIERFCASAERNVPGAQTVLVTPTPQPWMEECFDRMFPIPNKATEDNLCLERARVSVSWAKITDRPFLLADPDIEFLAPPRIHPKADVQLLWRTSKPDQPVNSGVVWSKPGQTFFWTHYGKIVVNLPQRTHGWFCDQLAYSLMTGVYHNAGDHVILNDTRVELVDARDHCERPGRVRSGAWAHHHKGWQHKGEEFRQWYKVAPKSGDGRPSAECA